MADETPRLGLPIYTSGTDLHPTREDFNDRMELLEEAVAIARQGTREDRPLPSTRGTLFMETDTRILWFDTGTEWIRVVRIGNDGPGRALNIGGSGSEGTSEWAARADHTHPLPLATASQPGALSAADKALLNTASANATSNALARRNGAGQMSAAAPSAASHVTNRGWVDNKLDSVEQNLAEGMINRGILPDGHLDNIDSPGFYRLPPPNVSRDAYQGLPDGVTEGRFILKVYYSASNFILQELVSLWGAGDRYSRGYDGVSWHAWKESITDRIADPYFQMLDGASPSNVYGALVRRAASGRIAISDPAGGSDAANKRYVDAATQDIRDATWDSAPGTLVRRGSASNTFYIDEGHSSGHAAQRGWVEDQIASAVEGLTQQRQRIRSGNLNDYTTAGVWSVWSSDFDQVSNLPNANSTIILEVTPAPSSLVRQDATNAFSGNRWWRSRTSSTWTDWQQVATV